MPFFVILWLVANVKTLTFVVIGTPPPGLVVLHDHVSCLCGLPIGIHRFAFAASWVSASGIGIAIACIVVPCLHATLHELLH